MAKSRNPGLEALRQGKVGFIHILQDFNRFQRGGGKSRNLGLEALRLEMFDIARVGKQLLCLAQGPGPQALCDAFGTLLEGGHIQQHGRSRR